MFCWKGKTSIIPAASSTLLYCQKVTIILNTNVKRRFTYFLLSKHGGGGGGGHSLVMGYWGCAAGRGRIFTTRLTITGSLFQVFSIELLEWGRTFSEL